ncbi:SGNH/GDSL hydrolase family protein [Kerstersia sp.]|uniref:SGNH/GDSL hydrolase family protein n=1 Tax=Kerstersia sp. TaxID=1930783 RepID=UPI003F938112
MSASGALLAGLSFLVIGESHMIYEFRDALYDSLHSQGAASVHIVGGCGASAIDWVKPRALDCGAERKEGEPGQNWGPGRVNASMTSLINETKPDVVMVIIGDTMGAYDKQAFPRVWAWQGVTTLTKEIAQTNTPCVWVGPAYGKEGGRFQKSDERVERLSRFLSGNVSPCVYIDSLEMAAPGEWRTFDGQHFNAAGYQSWSNAIVHRLETLPLIQEIERQR